MKSIQTTIKIITLSIFSFFCFFLFSTCTSFAQKKSKPKENQDYYVAAYVWPSCHYEPMSHEKLWGDGIGEWEIIQKGNPRFEGHYQPRAPLWGYQMDDDPLAWEQKIDAALSHGDNTFIFDWYWYDGKPFLEEAVNQGFLGAANNEKANFYIMWANHDVPGNMWNYHRYKTDSLIWEGEVDWENYKIIVDRVINLYFKKPNYLKINDEPVFSIYSLTELVQSFNGFAETRKALDYFREQVIKAGFPGLHLQGVGSNLKYEPKLIWREHAKGKDVNEIISALDLNSVTMYNMFSRTEGYIQDYLWYGEAGIKIRDNWDSILTIPFFPQVSIGWDNTPRSPHKGQ